VNGSLLLKAARVLSAAVIFGTGLGIAFFTWWLSRFRSPDTEIFVSLP
jgi:uncharacterized membrane protein